MMNISSFRRRLIVAGIILLAGGVVFEEWHRAATIPAHHPAHAAQLAHAPHPATELTDTADDAGTEFLMTNKNFEAAVDLWQNPVAHTQVANITYANFVFQSELHISPMDFDQLATRANNGISYKLPLTLVDKDIIYSLFSIGRFKATLNMTPVKAKPEDLIPTQLKPGLGGSFDF